MSDRRATPGRIRPAPDTLPTELARRLFLRRAVALGGGAIATGAALATRRAAAEEAGRNLPPNVPEWSRSLGAPILASPYGVPSKHEAKIVRRESPGLTRTPH